jgi:SAM-dependent methyltransferase
MKTGKQSIEESLNIDLEWDDKHVFPPVINPDLAYLYQRMGEATMEKMEVSGGENMLDIGCGRAIDVVELARRGGRCVGLEPSKSMINLAKRGIADTDAEVSLIQGIGEYLPFRTGSLNKVMCKGALESLGFKLGRGFHLIKGILFRKKPEERQVWEIPPDHTVRFDYALLRQLVNSHLKVERSIGISLLLGSPGWALLLAKLPKRVSLAILTILDKLARHLPSISDVVLLKCISKPESKAERQFLEESI